MNFETMKNEYKNTRCGELLITLEIKYPGTIALIEKLKEIDRLDGAHIDDMHEQDLYKGNAIVGYLETNRL